jgi:hypothetical protein
MESAGFGIGILVVTLIVIFLTASAYNNIIPLLRHGASPDEHLEAVARTDFVPRTGVLIIAIAVLGFLLVAVFLGKPSNSKFPGIYAALVAFLILVAAAVTAEKCSADDIYVRGSNIFAHAALMIFAMAVLIYILISLYIWRPHMPTTAATTEEASVGGCTSGLGTPRNDVGPL